MIKRQVVILDLVRVPVDDASIVFVKEKMIRDIKKEIQDLYDSVKDNKFLKKLDVQKIVSTFWMSKKFLNF